MDSEFIDGKEYRYVELRNRGKLIASDGSAINPIRRNQEATTYLNSDGYLCFGGGVPVHLYVAHGWVDDYFDGAEVNHKDFNRLNNNAENLEWISHHDNVLYSVKYNSDVWNISKSGSNNGRAKFNENDVRHMRHLYNDEHWSIVDILREYCPDLQHTKDYKNLHSNISNICRGKTWKCIV